MKRWISFIFLIGFFSVVEAIEPRGPAPVPSVLDSRIVVFPYQDNTSYTIYSLVGTMTHLSLSEGETLKGLYLSDSIRWVTAVSDDRTDIFIKPVETNLFNAITMITDQRKYHLLLVSVLEPHEWYHAVSWHVVPSILSYKTKLSSFNPGSSGATFNPASLFIEYEITGDPSIRPHRVFDNGQDTWMVMPEGVTAYPVLFAQKSDGQSEVVHYILTGSVYKVSQVRDAWVLVLGDKKAHVVRSKRTDGSKWNPFGAER